VPHLTLEVSLEVTLEDTLELVLAIKDHDLDLVVITHFYLGTHTGRESHDLNRSDSLGYVPRLTMT
jgi:hypothetical protein